MKTVKPPMTGREKDQARGMLKRGDPIQHVAYWFGRSPSTIHALKKGIRDWNVAADLPPPGPYRLVAHDRLTAIEGKAARADQAEAQLLAATLVVKELESALEKYRKLVTELPLSFQSTERLAPIM